MKFRISIFLAILAIACAAWCAEPAHIVDSIKTPAGAGSASAKTAADSLIAPADSGSASSMIVADSLRARFDSDSSSAKIGAVEGGFRPSPGGLPLETGLFRFINSRAANPLFDHLMPFITDLNNWKIVLLLVWCALVLFGGSKGRWAALMLIPLIASSDQICSSVIKPLAARMRPCEVLGNVHLWNGADGWITTPSEVIGGYKTSFSFPSSHAANITASMLFLGLVYRRWLGPLLAAAVAVSYSRIYIGVHWPLDAAAGMILGVVLALAAYWLYDRILGPERGGAGKKDKLQDAGCPR